jgi:hypothetical protein
MTSGSPRPACPACGSGDVLRIVYGLMSAERMAGRGIALGGCCVTAESPAWLCECGHRFGAVGRS